MTIASAITSAQGRVADCYTAISNKGGTLPATQNLSNMPTAIASIPSGGGGYSEFPSYQVDNGVASKRSGVLTGNEFSSITSISQYGLYNSFYRCSGLTGLLNLSNLTTVGQYGLYNSFNTCSGLTSVDLSSLTSVDSNGLYQAFAWCNGLTSINLSSLTSVDSNGLYQAFQACSSLVSVDLSSLTNMGRSGLYQAFSFCNAITDVYFNSLTTTSFGSYTNQFNNMMQGTGNSIIHTLHFPSNMQSTISTLTGYPLFGGTSGYVVLAFDLPATS